MDWCRFSYSESIILTVPVGFSRRRKTVCFLSTGSFVSLVRSNLTLQYRLTREDPLGTPPRAEWEEAWGKLFVVHGGCIPVPVPREDPCLCTVSVALLFGGPLHHDLKLHRFSWLPTLLGAASQVALGVKNLPTRAGDKRRCGSILGLGKSLGAGNGHLLQYSCMENSMDRGAWQALVHKVAESDATEHRTHTASYWREKLTSGEKWVFITSQVFFIIFKILYAPLTEVVNSISILQVRNWIT